MIKNSEVSKNHTGLIFRASSQGALWILLTLKISRVRSERKLAAPSERTFTGMRVVNTDRLNYSLSVFENFSCLQDIWLRYNETKTSRKWEERTDELIRVSKKTKR
jgi:hypothetical protein